MYEKVYASPRLPPKISLKHDWMEELGSEVARQTSMWKMEQNTIERGNPLFAVMQITSAQC